MDVTINQEIENKDEHNSNSSNQPPNESQKTTGFNEEEIRFKDRKYSIVEHKQLCSISHIFPSYDKNCRDYEPINYPVDSSKSKYIDEKKATPILIKHLENLLDLNKLNYKLIDVNKTDKCTFTIGKMTARKPNAVIVPDWVGENDLVGNVCVGFDFKTPSDISSEHTHAELILKFLGAFSARSNQNLPVLYVSTDLSMFRFAWFSEPETKVIEFYENRDLRYSINMIKLFIEHHNESAIKFMNLNVLDDLKRAKIEAAYKSLSEDKLKKVKFGSSITKSVYKIEIDNKPYVIKMASKNEKKELYEQLTNEENIYKYLSKLRKDIRDCIPKVYYSGPFLLDSYYAIVTEYIKGRRPSWDNESDRRICGEALRKINNASVLHCDARTANFVIVEKQRHMDSKGRCFAIEEGAVILDFGFSELRSFSQQEDLKYD